MRNYAELRAELAKVFSGDLNPMALLHEIEQLRASLRQTQTERDNYASQLTLGTKWLGESRARVAELEAALEQAVGMANDNAAELLKVERTAVERCCEILMHEVRNMNELVSQYHRAGRHNEASVTEMRAEMIERLAARIRAEFADVLKEEK